ncbi:MAG: urease accessory UreF family protein, partial [Pseudomonadota bacterium]
MGMTTPTVMLTDDALLTLVQWLSPAYPVGAFAYSHGLEWCVQAGDISDSASFRNWASAILRHGAGRTDAILLGAAYRADNGTELSEIDAFARALGPSAERRLETDLQGAAFGDTTQAIWDQETPNQRRV